MHALSTLPQFSNCWLFTEPVRSRKYAFLFPFNLRFKPLVHDDLNLIERIVLFTRTYVELEEAARPTPSISWCCSSVTVG